MFNDVPCPKRLEIYNLVLKSDYLNGLRLLLEPEVVLGQGTPFYCRYELNLLIH